MLSPFPCNAVIHEWLWKKTQIEKKIVVIKTLVFWENWFDSKVAGMKATFFAIFDQPGFTSWSQKAQVRNFLNSILAKKTEICDLRTD